MSDGNTADGGHEVPLHLRRLWESAQAGLLAGYLAEFPDEARSALYGYVSDLVFTRLTRPHERERGHGACALAPSRLAEECHDRHQDDVEAVFEDVLRHAHLCFANLGGWISSRMRAVTVDANRRRRGARGALQRPRLPGWLRTELGGDAWLCALAIHILTWVGVPTTAGLEVWPLGTWAAWRAQATGEYAGTEADVADDVALVLKAMRRRPAWFEAYVERPLGGKRPPVLPEQRGGVDHGAEYRYVGYRQEQDEAEELLDLLAEAAIEAITERIERGEDERLAVATVLETVFAPQAGIGDGAAGADRLPGSVSGAADLAAELILEPAVLDRVVEAVLAILAQHRPAATDRRAGGTGQGHAARREPRAARDEPRAAGRDAPIRRGR